MTPQKKLVRIWQFAGCEFDESTRELRVSGEVVEVETKPLEVLRQLLLHPKEVVSQDELFGAVWTGFTRSEYLQKSLFTAISKLRKVLPDLDPPIIATVPKFGYRLDVPVVERVADTDPRNTLNLEPGDPVPGRENWRVTEQLHGSFSEVWIAKHVKTPEMRVFKFAFNAVQLEGLKREMTLSRYFVEALPGRDEFVRVLDWNFDKEPFLLESAYGGPSLPKWFESMGGIDQVPLTTRLAIMASVANSVATAHGLGVLHKDLKPSNILISAGSQSNWQVRVADFGSATLDSAERLQRFQITNLGFSGLDGDENGGGGTWTYTAPEVREGGLPTAAADVFALGVMLYQMVIGDLARQLTVGWEAGVEDPLLRDDIQRAAAGDPAKRMATAAELVRRLSSFEERRRIHDAADADAKRALLNERRVMADHARRPWIAAALLVLLAGTVTSLGLYQRASQQRDIADARNADLVAMNQFLSKDLIGRSNPLQRSISGGSVQQETLIDAIKRATPQIDRRFSKAPAIAGQLHQAIAEALDARTDFADAQEQYAIAAQSFRAANGPLSQDAIIAELKRENVELRTHLPEWIARAQSGYKQQQQLISQLPNVTPELQAWQALAGTGSLMFGSRPEQGLPLLNKAIQRAQSTVGFSPSLLLGLKTRVAAIYLRLNDGAHAEQAARESIALAKTAEGPDSTALFEGEMSLMEALYLEGKFNELTEESGRDYASFSHVMGPGNQLTVSALYMKSAAEASLENYEDAIRDNLAIYSAERSNHSGKFIQEISLNLAASLECHAGRIGPAMEHARQVIRECGPAATNQPAFVSTAKFTLAECLISQAEQSNSNREVQLLDAENLLKTVDVPAVSSISGLGDFEGSMDVAEARLAVLRGKRDLARNYAEKATPFLSKPGSDAYESRALALVKHSGLGL